MPKALQLSPARLRGAVLAIVPLLAVVVVTQLVLPGDQGAGRGTPFAILFRGLVLGLLTALSSVGIVMLYRTLRIVNFAQGAMGLVSAVFLATCLQYSGIPFPIAFVLGVGISALLGLAVGIFTLRFFDSSRLFLTVVTIVGSEVFFQLVGFIVRLPIFPPLSERSVEVPTAETFRRILPFGGFDFQIGSMPLRFGFAEVFSLEVAILTLLAIGAFFRFTKSGVAVRAVAENSERASLLGIGVAKLSVIVWVIAGALAGITGMLTQVVSSSTGGGTRQEAFDLLLPILAAALVARMTSIPVAIYTSVLLGVAQQAYGYSYRDEIPAFNVALFLVLSIGLLVQRRRSGRSEGGAAVSWSATDESRPIPKELAGIPTVRIARVGLIAIAFIAVVAFPFIASTGRTNLAGVIFINAIAVLSLVVLTGWTGQVSLGQYAFVAVGAVVGGSLTSRAGVPFWLALPLGAAITGAVAFVVGLPALRVKGLFLMVTTFGFAVVVQSVLFDRRLFGWLLPTEVERPTLLFLDFGDERSMYFLCLAGLALCLVLVSNLRKSRTGRLLIALRENEVNVQSFGVPATRNKLVAFAISGALCGFAGVLFAHQQRGVSAESFSAFQSVQIFVQAVFGGVSSGAGALLGSAYFVLVGEFLGSNQIVGAFFSAGGPLLILFLAPGGLISLINQLRDTFLRVVAQRRQIVVPSLFADYDPDALARRLVPLADPNPTSGLSALPADHRFTLASELYAGNGERIIDKLGPKKEAAETAAISAAARSAADTDTEQLAIAEAK